MIENPTEFLKNNIFVFIHESTEVILLHTELENDEIFEIWNPSYLNKFVPIVIELLKGDKIRR